MWQPIKQATHKPTLFIYFSIGLRKGRGRASRLVIDGIGIIQRQLRLDGRYRPFAPYVLHKAHPIAVKHEADIDEVIVRRNGTEQKAFFQKLIHAALIGAAR